MLIRLRLDGRRPLRWHQSLAARIAALPGHGVEVDARPGPDAWPHNADLLFRLEALIQRLPRNGLSAPLDALPDAWRALPTGTPDLVIDLCGDVSSEGPARVWQLTFDGSLGEAGLLAALLDGASPVVALREGQAPISSARPGTELRGTMLSCFEDALARSETLVVATLSGARPAVDDLPRTHAAPTLPLNQISRRCARMLARKVAKLLHELCFRAPHWRVGWRRLDGPDLIDLRRHPESGWINLLDDGLRFYADPFSIAHQGHHVLFVEEWIHAEGKAVLSAVAVGPKGPVGVPEPVLVEPYHLSYPFVFEAEGSVWMVPESCSNGTVDLYRSTRFPGGWLKEATLLSGITASDATLLQRAGTWWMFATVRGAPAGAPPGTGSYSDALHLWSAPDFRGPWTEHPKNPVLIDIASARSAGRIVERGGKLIRPIQDCAQGYGQSLGLARIDRLDSEGFVQTVETRLHSGPLWSGSRLHTVNAAAGFEFIDGSARAPRLPAWAR